MASHAARGVLLGLAGLSILGGMIAVWRTRRPPGPGVRDADVEKLAPELEASTLAAMTPDAEMAPDAAVSVDEQLASLSAPLTPRQTGSPGCSPS